MGAFDGLRAGQISEGYWGNHTGSIDWCEDNYAQTKYIAEFVNTISNIPSFLLGLYGAWSIIDQRIPSRFALGYLGMTLIGIGSIGFHATLRWGWQLMDELPMIYVVSFTAYMSLDTLPGFKPRFGLWGPLVLIAWDVFVTVSYLYLPNPIYHEVAFAFILLTSVGRLVYLIHRIPAKHPGRQKITRTMLWGIVTFAGAFVLWNIDNIYCEQLRQGREYLGPFGFLLEGHGYWHLGTGYGSYLIMTAAGYLTLAVKTSPDNYDFDERKWFPTLKSAHSKRRAKAE